MNTLAQITQIASLRTQDEVSTVTLIKQTGSLSPLTEQIIREALAKALRIGAVLPHLIVEITASAIFLHCDTPRAADQLARDLTTGITIQDKAYIARLSHKPRKVHR